MHGQNNLTNRGKYMKEIAISQDELDKLLKKTEPSAPLTKKITNFSSELFLKKIAQDETLIKKQLKELKITITQEEVDTLF